MFSPIEEAPVTRQDHVDEVQNVVWEWLLDVGLKFFLNGIGKLMSCYNRFLNKLANFVEKNIFNLLSDK